VDFLGTQIKVESAEILPYKNQVTVLAEIFRCLPAPNGAQYTEVNHWFWRTSVSGYFGGWNTGGMASDQAAVKEFAAGKTAGIDIPMSKPNSDIWIDRTFRANNAHARLLAIVLAHHQPVDLMTGQLIDTSKALAWVNSKEFHHFFPRKYLERKGEKANRINCLANFVMLSSSSNKRISDSPPSEYLSLVAEAAGSKLDSWLSSNLIPKQAWDAALKDDFSSFLTLRAQFIHDAVMTKAGWIDPAESGTPTTDVPSGNGDDIE
jgi:hypothetical protein